MNPVFVKELKLSTRTFRIAFTLLIYNGVLAIIGLLIFYAMFGDRYSYFDYSDLTQIYIVLATLEFSLVLFLVPAFTASAISGERERQTLEILLSTKLRPVSIILGKLASSISLIVLLVISSMPILSIIFAFGGVRIWQLVSLLLYIIVTAVFLGSIGIYFSTVFRKTTVSTVFTYGSLLFIALGTLFIVFITLILVQNNFSGTGRPELPSVILILLINPIIGFSTFIMGQLGGNNLLNEIFGYLDNGSLKFIMTNWLAINITLQLSLSALFIFLASKQLNPLKQQKRNKRKRLKTS